MNELSTSRPSQRFIRVVCLIMSLLAILWMVLPMVESKGTLMGFAAGGLDPNHYSNEYCFGAPLTWVTWKHGWSYGLGYDEQGFEQFHIGNFVLHLLIIAVPIGIVILPTKIRTQSS